MMAKRLVKETETHVVIGLLFGLLLLLLSGGSLGGTPSGGRGTSSGRGGADGADPSKQLLGVLTLESLGEESSPGGVNLGVGGLDQGGDLLSLKCGKIRSVACPSNTHV